MCSDYFLSLFGVIPHGRLPSQVPSQCVVYRPADCFRRICHTAAEGNQKPCRMWKRSPVNTKPRRPKLPARQTWNCKPCESRRSHDCKLCKIRTRAAKLDVALTVRELRRSLQAAWRAPSATVANAISTANSGWKIDGIRADPGTLDSKELKVVRGIANPSHGHRSRQSV